MKQVIKGLKIVLTLIALIFLSITIFFGYQDMPIIALKKKYTNAASSFVSVNGMEVHFRDEGNLTDSIPLVLIHGTGSSLHTFDAWTNQLKSTHRIIRMDLPAYGLTGPFTDRNYSMARYIKFMKDFLNAIGVKHCIMVGNSLGGEIAWNFTLEQPKMVKKLVLIDAAGFPLQAKSVPVAFKLAQTPILNNLLTFITPRFLVRSSVENVYFNTSKVSDALVERYFELTLREGNRQAFVDRLILPKDTNSYKKLKQIQQPTLILWGANDLLIPVDNAYKFHEYLPHNTLSILEDTGHVPMEENPLLSLQPVIEFIKK